MSPVMIPSMKPMDIFTSSGVSRYFLNSFMAYPFKYDLYNRHFICLYPETL